MSKIPRQFLSVARLLPFLLVAVFAGCNGFRSKPATEYVYVVAKDTFLRDRVAAVSNRVGNVVNGQRLLVLEHGRRFLKVKTDKGEIGWIEEHGVIDQDTFTQFDDLQKKHANDPVVATAVLRDDLYLHVKPGRQEDRFYLLPEGDKLQLLVRASVPKVTPPQAVPLPVTKTKTKTAAPKAPAGAGPKAAANAASGAKPATATAATTPPPAAPEPPQLEDWWLIRDSQGKVGWMLSRRLDVDVPDTIVGYSEGQRIVGAYKLTTVSDPESNFPNGQAPEYVTVTSPYKDGLPYDFSQARIFIWNTRKHRYETAYRVRDIQGYLPVTVSMQSFDKVGTVPVFSFKVATDDAVAIDPATGAAHSANTAVLTYRLEGAIVRKVEPAPPPAAANAAPTPVSASIPGASPGAAAAAAHPSVRGRRARHRAAAKKAKRESHAKHHKRS